VNIFYLDDDPVKCAQQHCDKHVLKMILEYRTLLHIAQMELLGETSIVMNWSSYAGRRYRNHPCAKWARASLENYQYLQKLFYALLDEYTYRWGKEHKYEYQRSYVVLPEGAFKSIPKVPFTFPPQCMPWEYQDEHDTRLAYLHYYIGAKTHLLTYTRRQVPLWVSNHGLGEHK
jgi:hypothetical protein